jgi:hypothetical protein
VCAHTCVCQVGGCRGNPIDGDGLSINGLPELPRGVRNCFLTILWAFLRVPCSFLDWLALRTLLAKRAPRRGRTIEDCEAVEHHEYQDGSDQGEKCQPGSVHECISEHSSYADDQHKDDHGDEHSVKPDRPTLRPDDDQDDSGDSNKHHDEVPDATDGSDELPDGHLIPGDVVPSGHRGDDRHDESDGFANADVLHGKAPCSPLGYVRGCAV